MRAIALALIVTVTTLGGCKFAVQHPPITAGIVGGAMGLGTCELAGGDQKACFLIGGGAAAALGLITWIAILLGGEGNTVLNEPMTEEPLPRRKKRAPIPAPTPTLTPTPTQQPAPVPAPSPEPVPEPTPAPATP
jgi:outer membrane biosynthesis protein TonB